METRYDHTQFEKKIYDLWQDKNVFNAPNSDSSKKPYCIIMPPPNANDPLHVGHAMFVSIEDILIRYHRMLGDAALWLPGTDHAGIETQYVFEKKLSKEGKSRFQFDRDTLFKMIWDYVQTNSGVAIDQMKQLGASADWDRYRFTLDPAIVEHVLTTFERMALDNLIYRGERLVNYCVKCGTAYSDLEILYVERDDSMYYVAYPLDGEGEPVLVATVRPETIFADVAIAIHPTHPRAQELKDRRVQNPLTGGLLPIIFDEAVDPEFGTGALKITPAHDATDYEIGKRHNLAIIQAIGFDGKLTASTSSEYAGLKVGPARDKAVAELQTNGYLKKIDTKYHHNVSTCYRCGSVIEPLPLAQFFIKVQPLTKPVLEALDAGETKIHGAGHDKILKHWLTNLQDWNISRQIVWGIRMPIWYEVQGDEGRDIMVKFVNKNKEIVNGKISELLESYSLEEIEAGLQSLSAPKDARYVVSRTKPGDNYLQETDTFDTWFSSSQWPVVTLQATNPGDFDYYYPTAVMETAYDILMFWVMRMMMMGGYLTGKMPFKDVYLHGLVRDEKGQKMSKSKGNVINPLTLVEKYGADALRMALVMSTTAGHDSAVGEMKVKGMRNFTNKTWNAARFIKMKNDEVGIQNFEPVQNKEFTNHLSKVIKDITQQLEDLKIGLAAETAHNEFWHWYCDEAIEACKRGEISVDLMFEGLKTWLKLLHPFMPFATEAIWQEVVNDGTVLATQEWPKNI